MTHSVSIRLFPAAAALGLAVCMPVHASAQQTQPAPVVRPSPATVSQQPAASQSSSSLIPIQKHQHPGAHPTGDHLPEWLAKHKDLTPQQQQEALEKEPGFHDLPPATQQRVRERVKRLSEMPPEKRQRILQRNEAMERLTPEQRGEVRDAMKQLAALPPDQRRYVDRTFRGLRELSPAQRQNVLNSERFSHLTPEQRNVLNSLMKVEPLLPPPYDSGVPPQPQH